MSSNKIKKVSDLDHVESFLQIDLIKGFKYVDKAGEIINKFHKGNKIPVFEMGLQGLIIKEPNDYTKTLKISSSVIWSHFVSPVSLDQIENQFLNHIAQILKILKVKRVKRIGWRNYYILKFKNHLLRDEILNKRSPSKNLTFEEGSFSYSTNDIQIRIALKKVQKKDNEKTPGILIDIDCSYKKLNGMKTDNIDKRISNIKQKIRAKDMLEIINSLI